MEADAQIAVADDGVAVRPYVADREFGEAEFLVEGERLGDVRCMHTELEPLAEHDQFSAPIATAFSPDPHAALMVKAGTLSGIPAPMETCRAGLGPQPACRTCPM